MEPSRTSARTLGENNGEGVSEVFIADMPAPDNEAPQWVAIVNLLARRRRLFFKVGAIAVVLSAAISFSLPKYYQSTVRLMPPDEHGGAGAMLGALTARGGGALGAMASGLLGMKNTGALFVDLLHSRTVQEAIVDQLQLQKVYGIRYKQDTVKQLDSRTDVSEDHKSGVITLSVTDRDRGRAQAIADAYVKGLDQLVATVSTSEARRQRIFIEQRLGTVKQELNRAEQELSEFSSANMTLDVKDQTKAMVEAGATLQGQLIAAQAELSALQQSYGDENSRVRAVRAKIGELQRQIRKFGGTGAVTAESSATELYPPLKKLPVLGVRWADLYRTVKVQETVFELLTEQYELAKIEEAKEIPTVQVYDPPSLPEKKSWPPRLLLMVMLTSAALCATAAWIIAAELWRQVSDDDPRKAMIMRTWQVLRYRRWREVLG